MTDKWIPYAQILNDSDGNFGHGWDRVLEAKRNSSMTADYIFRCKFCKYEPPKEKQNDANYWAEWLGGNFNAREWICPQCHNDPLVALISTGGSSC